VLAAGRERLHKNRATASAFSDWVFEQTTRTSRNRPNEGTGYATRRQRMRLGAVTHRDIELFLLHAWTQKFLGDRIESNWNLYFTDNKKRPERIFNASRLTFGAAPLQCVPDLVLHCPSEECFVIIERKTTFLPEPMIPADGWPNVQAQLWCYSWIDEFVSAAEVFLVGHLWRREQFGGVSLCHRHPAWKRSNSEHEQKCEDWFRAYGGVISNRGT
jgi:hypothetical protein